jgi:hypothetical protein
VTDVARAIGISPVLGGTLRQTAGVATFDTNGAAGWSPSGSARCRFRVTLFVIESSTPKGEAMQYMLLIYDSEEAWAGLSQEEQGQLMSEYGTFTQAVKDAGAHVAGDALHGTSTATSIRVRDGERLVTDGPFAETKESLGGYYLIDVGTEEEAFDWAARIPSARLGTIEVRPVVVWNEDGTPVPLPEKAGAA